MDSPSPVFTQKLIWLIGGTSESVQLARDLVTCPRSIPCATRVTVTQASACANYPLHPNLQVETIRFSSDLQLKDWVVQHRISGILDASHPFATVISAQAMAIAKALNLPYLRFERAAASAIASPYVQELSHWNSIFDGNFLTGQRVLLTTGVNALPYFSQWHQRCELFARVLPSEGSLRAALAAGFLRDHLIAFQPPLSVELECALWRHWNISLVITKASGKQGGEAVKRTVAEQLKIPLLVVKRPTIHYPWKTESSAMALKFCQTSGFRR